MFAGNFMFFGHSTLGHILRASRWNNGLWVASCVVRKNSLYKVGCMVSEVQQRWWEAHILPGYNDREDHSPALGRCLDVEGGAKTEE